MTLQLNPQSDLAYDDLAKLLDEQGKTEAAAFYCREAVLRKPQSGFAHINFGIMLGKLRRFDEAMNELSAAARLDASDARPHFLMGQLLLQQGHDAEAVPHLRDALKLAPEDGQMLIFTASVLAADEDPRVRDGAEAHTLASKTVQLTGGQQPAALDALAMACAEIGQFDEAVQLQQQAIKLIEVTGQKDDAAVMEKRLKLYQEHQPWRASFKKN
jgi:tetratricopeptide (TPR) repeat protein